MASTPTRSAASTLLPSLRHLQFSGTAAAAAAAAAAATDVLSKSNLLNSSCVPIDGALLTSPNHLVRKNIEEKTYWLIHARSNSRWTPLSKASGFTSCAATLCTSRSFCSHPLNPINESQGAAAIDYCSVLQEDEFHKLADSTIHDLLEKLEEYGDSIDIDGFDIDYGNEVLTLKLGDLGTYVVNKQTPNRQIWLSSPVSGPSRFDWDRKAQAWIYRRTQANLLKVLETEIQKLCGKPLTLS